MEKEIKIKKINQKWRINNLPYHECTERERDYFNSQFFMEDFVTKEEEPENYSQEIIDFLQLFVFTCFVLFAMHLFDCLIKRLNGL